MKRIFLIGACLFIAASPVFSQGNVMRISSPDFSHNSTLPAKFTCVGSKVNPHLLVEGASPQAKTLALIVDDPDALRGVFVHWVVYNIPPDGDIKENSVPGKEGINSLGATSYVPPCPPSGTHRYFFKAYALDTKLDFAEPPTKEELEAAMQGHILDRAELIGLFKK